MSYGSSDNTRGGLVLSRYFNPYYGPRTGGAGMAAFMFKPPEDQPQLQQVPSSQYYSPDRRRQTQEENFFPQQNEVYYPQPPEKPFAPTEVSELADPTEKVDLIPTTARTPSIPELVEPEVEEVEEPVQKPKKRVTKRKQVKKPVEDEEEDDEYQPKMPAGAFFPMYFGYGGRGSGGMPGATAIANAYSTGRGGVATSHATAYGAPRPDFKDYKNFQLQP